MFDRAFKKGNTIADFRTKMVEGKERDRTELIQENAKKQKVEDDKETAELKQCLEIIPDEEEVTIDAIPLAVNQMLKSFDREDLEDLYKLVKAKYESTRPVEDLDLLLWGDLKTMFEPHVEDKVWRNQQEYKVLDWKLYDSCGVHSLRMQHMQIYMLVEKKYPLAPLTLSMMLEKKLIIDYETGVSTAQRLQRKYAKCLLLLVHNCSAEVNAASENMLEVTTASEYQEDRLRLLDGSHRASTSPSYSLGPSTPLSYSSRPSKYALSLGNAECSNCKFLFGKIKVLEATLKMQMHLENHTLDSTALLHELYNDMGKFGLE
ncbi:hypothetical protein Tco_0339899 [Tanacetum coccineum]